MTRPSLRLEPVDRLPEELLTEAGCSGGIVGGWLIRAGDDMAGLAGCEAAGREGRISLLYVTPAWRGLGYGSETVGSLLQFGREHGWQRMRALAPKGNGLSVYFWFRQGFRPERADDSGLTLVQELNRSP